MHTCIYTQKGQRSIAYAPFCYPLPCSLEAEVLPKVEAHVIFFCLVWQLAPATLLSLPPPALALTEEEEINKQVAISNPLNKYFPISST